MKHFRCKLCYFNDANPFSPTSSALEPEIKPDFLFKIHVIVKEITKEIYKILSPPHPLDNYELRLCKFNGIQVEHGPLLDPSLSLQQQLDELNSFLDKSTIYVALRTKLTLRGQALIDGLLNSRKRELKKTLFSLKQIFQDDKELVQEFVERQGLQTLRKIDSNTNESHQSNILRAIGQLMLYVDGMNGVVEDPKTIEWMYSLLQRKERMIVKSVLQILVVFIEFSTNKKKNATLIISSVLEYHQKTGSLPWSLIINILTDEDPNKADLLTFAMSLINKVLSAVPDRDTFYNVTDMLEEQGIEKISRDILNKREGDDNMVKQFQIYEDVLMAEDLAHDSIVDNLGVRNLPRAKSELNLSGPRMSKRRKSAHYINQKHCADEPLSSIDDQSKGNTRLNPGDEPLKVENEDSDTKYNYRPLYQPRRASAPVVKAELQDSLWKKRFKLFKKAKTITSFKSSDNLHSDKCGTSNNDLLLSSSPPTEPPDQSVVQNDNSIFSGDSSDTNKHCLDECNGDRGDLWDPKSIPTIQISGIAPDSPEKVISNINDHCEYDTQYKTEEPLGQRHSNDFAKQSVKAMKSEFAAHTKILEKNVASTADIPDLVTTAKVSSYEIIDKPLISPKAAIKNLKRDENVNLSSDPPDWSKLEIEISKSPLIIKDWDFSDLHQSEVELELDDGNKSPLEYNVLSPPPPPPLGEIPRHPPNIPCPPKPPLMSVCENRELKEFSTSSIPNRKYMTRLHWQIFKSGDGNTTSTIWNKTQRVAIDTEDIESLFERKSNEIRRKSVTGPKKIEVLDLKRSNAINIGMTNLPPISSIESSILNMHSNIINREGVEKLLTTMIPTQEEIDGILSAQESNKDSQVGQAERFLLELSDINLLQPRLDVWLFLLDFDQVEREILDSLMDLMCGIEEIYVSRTLICVLSTLLTLGNFLNSSQITSFDMNYLQKISEIKDTQQKHSLLYHVVMLIVKEFPDSTDLHSDLGALNRCHKRDWEELSRKLQKLKSDCKRCWDHLQLIFKSDQTTRDVKTKLKIFYRDASEAIVCMEIIHRRVTRRFEKVLEYLGYPKKEAQEIKIRHFCRIMSDFSVEYRTTREIFKELEKKKVKEKPKHRTPGTMTAGRTKSRVKEQKDAQNDDREFINAIMYKSSLNISEGMSDLDSLGFRQGRRFASLLDGLKPKTRPISLYQLDYRGSTSNLASMTPTNSDVELNQSSTALDIRTERATLARDSASINSKESRTNPL